MELLFFTAEIKDSPSEESPDGGAHLITSLV